ncbi:hypothetical protein, conserved [Babesia bigemina]|uniref:C3H1-type domain-containing protein n=1 Tax=Babesia bigemina TaxID=5866 RepID=A0A061BU17_BABBI|nr:hypothetical protein, conserved [Babesia bigemina]CDR71959.1 hypothetical protein, conserved [Babesia bigemina]|eukprot:XP_012770901.1 hypothetical protein, conserved [Babesia bigemina]
MGFLSGVLGAVKNTQTYNVGKNTLQNLVSNEINNHLCSGHEGFKRLFEKLPKEIEKYNRDVKKQNDDITAKINNLEMQLNTMNDKVSKVLENDAVSGTTKKSVQAVTYSEEHVEYAVINIRQYLRDCQYNADRFNEAFDLEQRLDMQTAVNDLNSKLRNDVLVATKAVKHETQRLEQLAQKEWDDYKYMKRTVRATMESLKLSVNGEVKYQVDELVKKLKEKVTEMKNNLEPIRDNLGEYIGHLTAWKSAGDTAVTKAKSQCDEIVSKLNGRDYQQNSGDKGAVKKAAKALQEKAEELRTKAYDAKQQVEQKVQEALKAVHQMNDDLKQDLSKVREAITGEVDKVKQAIGKLYAGITTGESGEGNENQEIKNIVEYFRTKLKEITGSVGGRENPKTGLMGIIFQVREYAKTFQNRFKASIQSMVQQLVECEGIQERLIKSVKAKLGRGNMIRVDEEVKRIIQQRIISPIEAINASSSNLGTKPNVEANLSDIKEYLCNYGKQIDEHLQRANAFLQSYAKQFEHSQNRPEITGDYFISRVVKTILTALQKAVKGAENEFDQFIIDSKIAQLSIATSAAETLEDNVKKALGIGSGNNTVAVDVDKSINNVNAVARQQLPGNSVSSVDLSQATSSFTRYTKHVDQSKLTALQTTNLNAILDANKLPHAIKGINDQVVAETLKDVVEEKNGGDTQIHNKTFSTLRTAVDSSLDKFTEAVEKLVKKDSVNTTVNAYLLDLEKMLKESDPVKVSADGMTAHSSVKGLEKIIGNFTTLKNNLESGPIALADYFIESYADAEKDQTIRNLIDYVYSQVNIAKDLLTTAARRNYVTSVKSLLTAFADKVEKELAGLPGEIDADLTIGFKGLMGNFYEKFIDKIKPIKEINIKSTPQSMPLSTAAEKVQSGFEEFVGAVMKQTDMFGNVLAKIETSNHNDDQIQDTFPPLLQTVISVSRALEDTFSYLTGSHHFDYEVIKHLQRLQTALNDFTPTKFGDTSSPILQALKEGFFGIVTELQKVYINTYSGQTIKWEEGNPETTFCAKAFLSALEFLNEDLSYLREQCTEKWSPKQIYASSSLGTFLHKCGYGVATLESKQDGELRNKPDCMGSDVRGFLVGEGYTEVYNSKSNIKHALQYIYDYLPDYYDVCHLSTSSSKRPCSVYEMLCWLTGLPHNKAYNELLLHGLSDMFVDPKRQEKEVDGDIEFTVDRTEHVHIDAYPNRLTYENTCNLVDHICAKSHDVLCRILGTGDENTMYAVDYSTNSLKLYYPSSGEECLDMFLNILRRLFPPLKYLQTQCGIAANEFGWAGCRYGKDVHTTKWPCSGHSSSEATCHANCQTTCQPTCQPKSPLMSYLNDCLPGHLPHALTGIGCKAKCSTCPKSTPGMPCITPLGFRCFSGTKREGRDISDVLGKFFDNGNLKVLFSLQAKTPSTLPEHFGFALSFVKGWSDVTDTRNHSIKQSIEASIADRSINLYEPPSTLTDKLRDAYGSKHIPHLNKPHLSVYADLSSLAVAKPCSVKDVNCAPYLSSLCIDTYHHLAKKQSNTYLSWAIYLPWTFWDLLNNLYNAFCSINCQDWGCRGCLRGDKCKKGGHGVVDEDKPSAICQCRSIVDCKGVAPTLYQYGFVFGEASTLNDKASPKTCSDFCSQLKNVLHSKYFERLFEECDNFLWKIREPFSYLVLALWLFSFLYLLHIMVIRLDLLHIKSHLHSPSSHRIAAQSLLAAGRVNKLNRVFYLQP